MRASVNGRFGTVMFRNAVEVHINLDGDHPSTVSIVGVHAVTLVGECPHCHCEMEIGDEDESERICDVCAGVA
jgi:hypothetical protein